ncbi:MAG: hypothetical protein H0X64_09710 [Gemmatimonadaceae bacterium]|nr:hypothetical protein [Gemmatimonadaceae bacterium]
MQTEWNSVPSTRSAWWRRAEWALFIVMCAVLAHSIYAYMREPGDGLGMVLLGGALVAMTGGPLLSVRHAALRWIALGLALVLLGGSFWAMSP